MAPLQVPDGTHTETRTTTDSEGNSSTTTVEVQDYSTVEITLFFKNVRVSHLLDPADLLPCGLVSLASTPSIPHTQGKMHVEGESSSEMCAGFVTYIEYHDGEGSGVKPR